MKWLSDYRKRLMLVGFIAALVGSAGQNAKADFTFGTPTKLGPPFNSSSGDAIDCISADGLELYLASNRSGAIIDDWDIWIMTRDTIDEDWRPPVNLGTTVNSSDEDLVVSISPDGLELYFNSYARPGGYGRGDIWVTRRSTKNTDWGSPVNLGPPINTWNSESGRISADGLEFYINAYNRPGGYGGWDLWISRRETLNDAWGEPVNLGSTVNSSAHEMFSCISPDGRTLFFSGYVIQGPQRPGGHGGADLWVTMRTTKDDDWSIPVNLGPKINSSQHDDWPCLSPDCFTLYFHRGPAYGTGDIWQAPIIPIVDLNADGIVDSADMCIMVDYWGTDESLCDIGPMPWGDGIVDVQDLIVLAEHLFEEVPPAELVE